MGKFFVCSLKRWFSYLTSGWCESSKSTENYAQIKMIRKFQRHRCGMFSLSSRHEHDPHDICFAFFAKTQTNECTVFKFWITFHFDDWHDRARKFQFVSKCLRLVDFGSFLFILKARWMMSIQTKKTQYDAVRFTHTVTYKFIENEKRCYSNAYDKREF